MFFFPQSIKKLCEKDHLQVIEKHYTLLSLMLLYFFFSFESSCSRVGQSIMSSALQSYVSLTIQKAQTETFENNYTVIQSNTGY